QLGPAPGDDGGHLVRGMDETTLDALADLGRIAIEQGHDAEAALDETGEAQQSAGQVADADQHGVPLPVDAEDAADGRGQVRGLVADAGMTEVEGGQVLAYLDVAEAERLAEQAAGDARRAAADQAFEAAQVQTEAHGGGARRTCLAVDPARKVACFA